MTPNPARTDHEPLRRIRDEILARHRFLITSHLKPDGDSIGSQVALAYALRALGKDVRIVNCDPAQPGLLPFPGVSDIEIASHAGATSMRIVSNAASWRDRRRRAGVLIINHHPGNAMHGGQLVDAGAAA
jgi:phosphoesterase RecJ-like protein